MYLLSYNILMAGLIAAGLPILAAHVAATEKRRKTFLHRLGTTIHRTVGQTGTPYPGGKRPVWIHALSVGEVLAAVPLVRECSPEAGWPPVDFSATTLTGVELARQQLSGSVRRVFYSPYDLLFSVRRVSTAVNPSGVIIVESDLWPNFLFEMQRRQVPVVLANGRMSDRSFRGFRRMAPLAGKLFGSLSLICAQTEADAQRFEQLGVSKNRLVVTGNIKFDWQGTEPVRAGTEQQKKMVCGNHAGRVVVAGSTHEGEEEMIAGVFPRLKRRYPDLTLIVAPRDPRRAEAVCRIFRRLGFVVRTLTAAESEDNGKGADVVVVDVIGRLRQLYGLGDAAFVGGSLVDSGGHNPLEPAAWAVPAVFGPHTSDFREICRLLEEQNGAHRVNTAEDLAEIWIRMLEDRKEATDMGKRAASVLSENHGAVSRTVRAAADCFRLPPRSGRLRHSGNR